MLILEIPSAKLLSRISFQASVSQVLETVRESKPFAILEPICRENDLARLVCRIDMLSGALVLIVTFKYR